MKILFAVHSYFPMSDGVSVVTQYLAEGLANRHQVEIITEKKEKLIDVEVHKSVKINRINVCKQGNIFYGDKKVYLDYIQSYVPDVLIVVCTQTWALDWINEKIDELNCKKVLYSHGFSGLAYSGILKRYPIWKSVLKGDIFGVKNHFYWKKYYSNAYKILKRFDLTVFLSENGDDVVYAKKYDIQNYVILENAVQDYFFQDNKLLHEERYSCDYPVTFLCVANYMERKNQKMIVSAFYKANLPNATLILAGSKRNYYYEELVNLKKELEECYGCKNVDFLYGLSRKQIYELYERSDIFVLASSWEQFPVVLCESGSLGMAVISTRVGHSGELPGCILFDTENELVGQMNDLYSKPEMRWEHGKVLREFCEKHYKIEDKVQIFEKYLMEL